MTAPLSDDEALAAVERRQKLRRRWSFLVSAAGAVAIFAGAGFIISQPYCQQPSLNQILMFFGGVLVLGFAALGVVAFTTRLPRLSASQEQRVATQRIDRLQGSRRLGFILMPVYLLWQASLMFQITAMALKDHSQLAVACLCAIALFAVIFAFALDLLGFGVSRLSRRALNDELSAAHRAKALRTGFVVALLGCAGTYIAGLVHVEWALYLLPIVIMVAVSAAALHFAWLDWRADA